MRVILESPYAARTRLPLLAFLQRWRNRRYARRCLRDSLGRGEAPMASHLLYTQPGVLRDHVAEERWWGINAGLSWGGVADATVVYVDRGLSDGMRYGIAAAQADKRPVEYRSVNGLAPDAVQQFVDAALGGAVEKGEPDAGDSGQAV